MSKNFKKLKKVFADDPEMLRQLAHEEMMASTKEKSAVEIALHLKKGDQGEPGYTPEKGVDYLTDEEIGAITEHIKNTVKEEVRPLKNKDYFDGKDGKDADEDIIFRKLLRQIPTVEEIAAKVKAPPMEKMNTEYIIKSIMKALPSPYIPTIDDIVEEIKKKKLLHVRDIAGARLDGRLDGKKGGSDGFDMNDQRWHGAGSGGTGSSITLETNGVLNGSQVLLNLVQGTNMVITDDGFGNITFDASGGGSNFWSRDTSGDAFLYPTTNGDNVHLNSAVPNPNSSQLSITANGAGAIELLNFGAGDQEIEFDVKWVGGDYIAANTIVGSLQFINGYQFWVNSGQTIGVSANLGAHPRMNIAPTGAIQFGDYGSGTFSGSPAFTLAVDASGNVIEITPTSGLTLQTNGTPNGSQTLLNLKDGTGISITDDGTGGVTIAATGSSTPTLTHNQVAYGDAANLMTSDANFTRDSATFETAIIYPAAGGNLEIKNGATLGSDMISFKQNDANNPITFALGNTGGLGGGADSVFLLMQDVALTKSSDWYMDAGDWEISLGDGTTSSGMQSTVLYSSMNHFTGTVVYRYEVNQNGFEFSDSSAATNGIFNFASLTTADRTYTFPDASGTVALTSDLSIYELLANKATDFSVLNNTLYPTTQAVATYVTNAVIGLLDYRGSYDASTNLFPATGGSGILGAILKGDFWICSVGGTLGGTAVTPGDLIIALVDTPGQAAGNWDLISHDLGYTPANAALSNLASVAINAALIPGTAGALDFGSTAKPWKDIWFSGGSGTPGTNQFKLTGTSTSGLRTVTFQDASGTVAYLTDIPVVTGFATRALDNLAAVAINTTLVSDTDNTDDLGTSSIFWRTGYFKTSIELGATDTTLTRAGAGDVNIEGNKIYRVGGQDVSLADGGTGASLVDPAADKLWGWDDTDNSIGFWVIGTGLSYDHATHTLSATGGSGITIGTTTITSGTDKRILYDNAGVVGEYTITGSGTVVAMATAPTFITSIATPAVLATANDSGALGASGTAFSDLFLASGALIDFAAGNAVITHSSGILTVSTGTLKIANPTNNTTSVVTIDATQTFTNKTMTASSNVLGGVTMTLGSDADGDIYYRSSNVLTRLGKGTAGQILGMNAAGTAPAWGTAMYQQTLALISATTDAVASNEFTFGSMTDGSAFFIRMQGTQNMQRFARDAVSGSYYMTHQVSPALVVPSGDNGAIINISDKIYVFTNDGTNIVCTRYDAADMANAQVMSVPTVACTTFVGAWTDGTDAYIVSAASATTSRRWTVSGTTFSAASTATVTTGIFNLGHSSSMWDGTTAYFIDGSAASGSGNFYKIYKLTSLDGSATTTTNTSAITLYSDTQCGGIILRGNSSSLYYGTIYQTYNATVAMATLFTLFPFAKP